MVVQAVEIIEPQAGSQWEYVASSATECAMLGKAGGGKSYALLLDYLYDIEHAEHTGIILRRTYKDLEDLIAKSHRIYPALGAKYSEQKHRWDFPAGAKLWMGYLDHDKDVFRYDGWELSWIGWDEINQFGKMPYMFMMTRLRCANPKILKRVRSTGIPNPNSVGTAWVWDRFCKALPEGETGYFTTSNNKDIKVERGQGVSRQWFFSRREENRALMDHSADYEQSLALLPDRLKLAYKDGLIATYSEPDQLIHPDWWDAAVNGRNAFEDGAKAFGLDYAEQLGHDASVACVGKGNQPFQMREWEESVLHPEMARIIRDEIFHGHGWMQIHGGLDSVGTGAGVYTSLLEFDGGKFAERTDPIRYKDPEFDKKYEDAQIKYHFRNIQDQILWKLREGFMNGQIDLSQLLTPEHYYENLDKLKEEVLAFWWREDKGDIWISGGQELRKPERTLSNGTKVPCLGRSPDRVKALAIWWWVHDRKPRSPRNKLIPNADYNVNHHTKAKPRPRSMAI
jgi:hypothetical protein